MLKKILCLLGYHRFTFTLQDCLDEFGFVPTDSRGPKTARCERCKIKYHKIP